jgi:hypothetical protein
MRTYKHFSDIAQQNKWKKNLTIKNISNTQCNLLIGKLLNVTGSVIRIFFVLFSHIIHLLEVNCVVQKMAIYLKYYNNDDDVKSI